MMDGFEQVTTSLALILDGLVLLSLNSELEEISRMLRNHLDQSSSPTPEPSSPSSMPSPANPSSSAQ